MKASPHTHVESPLTGSTVANMVARAKELGRTHFAYTDHGHLSSCLKTYGLVKKKGLKFIPGLEFYFKDAVCPITAGTAADRCKYFTSTIHCKTQEAYQKLAKLMSREDLPVIEIYEEKQQLWNWETLHSMVDQDITLTLGGIHCMVGKVALAGKPDLAETLLLHLKSILKDKLYISIVCEPWSKKYSQIVEIQYADGTRSTCLGADTVSTDKARKIKAFDLLDNNRHALIKAIYKNGTFEQVDKTIKAVKLHKGFLPLPGGDALLKVNKFLLIMSKKHGIPALVSDYAYYANKEDKIVQTMRLEGNNKLFPNLHMKSSEEVSAYLSETLMVKPEEISEFFNTNEKWAASFDNLKLDYQWRLADPGEDPLKKAMAIIRENGRMRWDDPVWVARLKEELNVIAKNPVKDLTAYFLPIRDVLNHYKENGLLTGPGRGSAGGSLFCYLLGITQINPFKYDLPFNRFFSMERIMMRKLPDIDVDLEGRELLVGEDGKSGYLYGRWGTKAAQISTRTTIRLKSAIKDTNRYFKGKVEESIETFTKGLPPPPQGVSDHDFVFGFEDENENHIPGLVETSEDLKKYSESRPEEWEIVSKAMGLTRAFSKHASAFVLADVPISDVVPTKEGYITQYEAKECEAAGLIKYDFLVINQLKDIRVCLELINKRLGLKLTVGQFMHDNKEFYIWDLPEDPEVYKSIWGGQTEAIFQVSTRSMTPAVIEILPSEIMHLANILALIRPGPVDCIDPETGRNMVDEYYLRRKGEVEANIKELVEILPETYGIMIFQEQLGKISRVLAGFSGEDAEKLRENMAKKRKVELMKMKPMFIEGASKKVPVETAEKIWEQMETFGRYGFSIIHAVEYAMITYACMFLKHYYPLEWWAAILTNATEQEITGKFWPYVKDMVSPPDINLSSDMMAVDYANGKIRAKMGIIRGMGEATIDPIVTNRPYKDIQDFIKKEPCGPSIAHKLIIVGVLDSLFPPRMPLIDKLKMYQDEIEKFKFEEYKSKKTPEQLARMRATEAKEGVVPEKYVNMTPLEDVAFKKSVLPSMPINLYELGKDYSKIRCPGSGAPRVMSLNGHPTMLINGERLQRLDEHTGEGLEKDIYVAATCFVVKTEEFSYAKGAKRALKMVLDSDGYISEKVMWPDFNTGELMYPQNLKKGCIATVFFRKKVGKKDMSVQGVHVET